MTDTVQKTALVTGASRGIGQAIAIAYASAGFRVAVHYGQSLASGQETLFALEGEGHTLVQADVADPEAVRRIVEETVSAFGRLDVLVNNAGIYEMTPFDTPDYAQWQTGWKRVLDVNLTSAANATFCVLPTMRAQGGGKIINVASRSAFRAETDAPAYAVSKAGMVNLTRCLARAEAKHNVLAYAIAPGWVETAMAREGMETMEDEILSQIPLGRIASVDDVAGVAVFLASPAADYLTGICIDVNGGSYLH